MLKKVLIPFLSLFILVPGIALAQEYEDYDYDAYMEEVEDMFEEYEDYSYDDYYTDYDSYGAETLLGGALAGIGIIAAIVSSIFGLIMYAYSAFALMTTAKKLDYKNPWFAWIPILNSILLFELGDFNPWLLLLMLIPGVGALAIAVMSIICMFRITEKRGFDKMLALLLFVPVANLIFMGILAWGEPKK